MSQSLYLHVPFCDHICAYCDFERCRSHPLLMEKWCERIIEEIAEHHEILKTCYIGGGTPSALPLDLLEKLLQALSPLCQNAKEFTVEANIENLTPEKCRVLSSYHVNRISLGIQTLQDELLRIIERHHRKEDVEKALQMIHEAGIHNISVDLIYGLPSQTLNMWQKDLEWAASHPLISHISIYSLTIEENSKFGRQGIEPCSEELDADMYESAIQILKSHGYEHYEISNFAKNGRRSLHNIQYWKYHDFIGLGCGAYGLEDHVYYHIPFQLNDYIKGTLKRIEEIKSKEDEMFECVMMGLRLREGINRHDFLMRFDIDLADQYKKAIQENIQKGYLELTEDSLFCTPKGFELLHEVLLVFMP